MTAKRPTFAVVCVLWAGASTVFASGGQPIVGLTADQRPAALREVGIDPHLGGWIPSDLVFRDESGKTVSIGDYFGTRPILLSLNYFHCPMLCPMVFEGLVRSLRPLSWNIGGEFTIVSVSIDPRETPEIAAAKKRKVVDDYARAGAAESWSFLTGDAASIERLTAAAGFRYTYDAANDQYAHAAVLLVLTPQGQISRYLYGLDYAPRDVRLALVEASGNQIGTITDQILLFCFHYDPATGKYGAASMLAVRLGAIMTVLGLAGFVLSQWRRERSKAANVKALH
ncbi:MAG: SCO family protein [Candidatus Binatia bacterium]